MTKSIMYHYVRPNDAVFKNLKKLNFENFKKQLDYFEGSYGIFNNSDLFDLFKFRKIKKGIILTFDDGLSCHYNWVYNELVKREKTGVFYIPVGPFLNGKILDVHRIHILLSVCKIELLYNFLLSIDLKDKIDTNKFEEFEKFTYTLQKNDDKTLSIKRILNYYLKYQYRESIIDFLFQKFIDFKISVSEYYMSIKQLKEMSNNGMIIGSHTVNHKVLSKLNYEEQDYEISNSIDFIENEIGYNSIKTFCFPYGGNHSFNKDSLEILEKNKCDFSFSVESKNITMKNLSNNLLRLPRFDCNQFLHGSPD